MRGIYLVIFGILGLVLFGCIGYVAEEEGEGEIVITTDEECPGCAPSGEAEEGAPPAEEEPEEEEVVPEALTLEEAREIAQNSPCMEDGNLTGDFMYNNYTYTWWFDMDIEEPGCAPACVVDEETKTAEINWRCTGAIPPEENETGEVEPPENVTGCVGPSATEYNIYIIGEVVYNGETYGDECTLATVVKDYYCQNGELKQISTECPPGFDCRDGRCKQMEYSCTKTDNGDVTVKGRIRVAKGLNVVLEEFDECVDEGTVREWKCAENGSGYYEDIYCGSGMKCKEDEGRCIRSSCDEDDGGDVPEVRGEVEVEGEKYRDACLSEDRLREYYCYGESVESRTYVCSNECDDDQCVPVYD